MKNARILLSIALRKSVPSSSCIKLGATRLYSSQMQAKEPLLIIPSPEIQQLVETIIRPQLSTSFDPIVIGRDFNAFKDVLAKHNSYVLCCGMFVPGMKELVVQLISESSRAKPKWIHSFLAGVDHLLTPAVKGCHCPVTNAKGCFSGTLAEYALCACMYFDKQIPRLQTNQRNSQWERFVMGELRGKTIGILGYGDIGHTIGKLAQAFGMKVIAARRSPTGDIEANGVQVYKWQDRVEVLKNSDFVVASLPGTPETKHCIDMSSFKEMKPDAVFINVGRGSTVKEVDLIEALKKKIIKGAACDVFEVEPLPNTSELYQLPNMLISPHNADNTPSYYPSTVERFVTLAKQYYLKSLPFPSLVDLDLGY